MISKSKFQTFCPAEQERPEVAARAQHPSLRSALPRQLLRSSVEQRSVGHPSKLQIGKNRQIDSVQKLIWIFRRRQRAVDRPEEVQRDLSTLSLRRRSRPLRPADQPDQASQLFRQFEVQGSSLLRHHVRL